MTVPGLRILGAVPERDRTRREAESSLATRKALEIAMEPIIETDKNGSVVIHFPVETVSKPVLVDVFVYGRKKPITFTVASEADAMTLREAVKNGTFSGINVYV